tara:strand:+ start:565 stop:1944 length:1380 start_codon:yes stop_codon:yes gene_type:complete
MSDIKARRNSLLKSSISINSIRSSVTNFTKGLFSSRETASEIVNKTRESNVFKQRLISRDNILFRKRRENVKRREREDELEASGISGMIKRQGSVIAQSTKGFLGRILDFFGIILIGWFVTRLPKILDALGGLINRIKKVTEFLTNFVTGVTDFLFNFGLGIGQALQKLPKIDLLALNRKNQEELDLTNTNLVRVSNDLVDVGNEYNRGGQVIGLNKVDGSDNLFDIANPEENKEKPNQTKTQTETETIPSDSVEGKPAEKITKFKADDTKLSLNSKKDDDGDELIKGIQNESEFKDIKSAQSREKGETIDNKNLENESKKDQDQEGKKTLSDIKISAEKFFGNIAQQQTDVLKAETLDKKDNSSTISGVISNIKQILPDTEETDKKITPTPKNRTTVSRNFNKKRNQVIIMEKAVAMNTPSMSVGGGGKSNGLNNLGGFNIENEKRVIKNLQSVILNT